MSSNPNPDAKSPSPSLALVTDVKQDSLNRSGDTSIVFSPQMPEEFFNSIVSPKRVKSALQEFRKTLEFYNNEITILNKKLSDLNSVREAEEKELDIELTASGLPPADILKAQTKIIKQYALLENDLTRQIKEMQARRSFFLETSQIVKFINVWEEQIRIFKVIHQSNCTQYPMPEDLKPEILQTALDQELFDVVDQGKDPDRVLMLLEKKANANQFVMIEQDAYYKAPLILYVLEKAAGDYSFFGSLVFSIIRHLILTGKADLSVGIQSVEKSKKIDFNKVRGCNFKKGHTAFPIIACMFQTSAFILNNDQRHRRARACITPNILQLLLDNKADINARDEKGETSLDYLNYVEQAVTGKIPTRQIRGIRTQYFQSDDESWKKHFKDMETELKPIMQFFKEHGARTSAEISSNAFESPPMNSDSSSTSTSSSTASSSASSVVVP